MTALRVALIGLGDIGTTAHLPALIANSSVELYAVADIDSGRLALIEDKIPRSTARLTDPTPLIEDADVDAVVLATPPWITYRLAKAALNAGKYVLAEKPLAPSMAQTADLRALPESKRDRLQIGFTYRHDPAMERLRDIVRSGAFGTPLLVRFGFFDEPANPLGNPDHYQRIVQTLKHGAPIVHEGAHICDWLGMLLQDSPVEIDCWHLRTDPAFAAANVNGFAIRYPGNTLVVIEVAWLYPEGCYPSSHITITGPNAHAQLDPVSFELTFRTDTHVETLVGHSDRKTRCFALQLERFVASCRAGATPVPGIREALASLEYTDMLASCLDRPR